MTDVVIGGRESEQGVEHLVDVRRAQLLDAALLRQLPEHARGPAPSRGRVGGLPAHFLRIALLGVRHDVRRLGALEGRRQVNAGRIQQREQQRSTAGSLGWIVPARNRLPVAQVVDGALIGGELLAVEIGGIGDDLALAQIPLDLQGRQVVPIRATDPFGRRGIELPLCRIGVRRPVGRVVVLVLALVEDAGRDGESCRSAAIWPPGAP